MQTKNQGGGATGSDEGQPMLLEEIVHKVEAQIVGFGRLFYKPDAQEQLRDEVDRLGSAMRKRRIELSLWQGQRNAVANRLSDRRARAQLALEQVEEDLRQGFADMAWRRALELDRLRESIEADEASLRKQDQVIWSLEFNIRLQERRLNQLEAKARTVV